MEITDKEYNNDENEEMGNFIYNNNKNNLQNKYGSPVTNQINTDIILNNNSLYKSYSNAKKYLNFSSQKNSAIKNLDFYQLIDLESEEKNKMDINNETVYNEIVNNLNDIINKLKIEDSRNQNFFLSKNNLYSNIKYFMNDIANYDEEKANKLLMDLEDIKSKYDYYINNINKISKIDWELLDDLIINYNDYCQNFLSNIKNIKNINEIMILLKININQIINNYFNYKAKKDNILLSNHKTKNFLNNKRKLDGYEDVNKFKKYEFENNSDNINETKNNVIIINKDCKGNFNKYVYYKWKNDDTKNIYDKNLIPKYISLSIYICKNEKEDCITNIVQSIKNFFSKYIISYKNRHNDIYIKIKFCGVCSKPKLIVKNIKKIMKNILKEKSLVKIYLFSNLKDCLYKVVNQININNEDEENSNYAHYNTNMNISYLKQLINI